MTLHDLSELERDFRESLLACRLVYRQAASRCVEQHPVVVSPSAREFVQKMDDLHAGLVVKVYFEMCLADRRWSQAERRLFRLLLDHVWGATYDDDQQLRQVAMELSAKSSELDWFSLVRPFAEIPALQEHIAPLEAAVVRLANLVAKVDGAIGDSEARMLKTIQQQIETHLYRIPLDDDAHADTLIEISRTMDLLPRQAGPQPNVNKDPVANCRAAPNDGSTPAVEELIRQLDELVGLNAVKQEVRTLSNFLFVQQQRLAQGLPATASGLHMVFTGNPGTGKTTIARLLGRILQAMRVLEKGHLVECDRSGLVAEYVGQTSNKANRKIDEALDGILFVDEAYSLVAHTGEDAFGHEALQTLLKRMEDDRARLVVIVAGYPQPMERLLQANPGLSSRFQRTLHFEDYGPLELCRIFGGLCQAAQYKLTPELRAKLLLGFRWMYDQRDEHFGNGRLVRNLFEDAVRRMANRIAPLTPLTHQLLTRLEAEDVAFDQVPKEIWRGLSDARFVMDCPSCGISIRIRSKLLGRRVRCKNCTEVFQAEWALPAES